jgi:hypothetical protein
MVTVASVRSSLLSHQKTDGWLGWLVSTSFGYVLFDIKCGIHNSILGRTDGMSQSHTIRVVGEVVRNVDVDLC